MMTCGNHIREITIADPVSFAKSEQNFQKMHVAFPCQVVHTFNIIHPGYINH